MSQLPELTAEELSWMQCSGQEYVADMDYDTSIQTLYPCGVVMQISTEDGPRDYTPYCGGCRMRIALRTQGYSV